MVGRRPRRIYCLDAAHNIKVGKPAVFHKDGTLDWVTVTFWPAIVTVPDLVMVGFIDARNVTAALPLSVLISETDIQFTLLFAVKSQFDGAVMLIEKYPPLVGTLTLLPPRL